MNNLTSNMIITVILIDRSHMAVVLLVNNTGPVRERMREIKSNAISMLLFL